MKCRACGKDIRSFDNWCSECLELIFEMKDRQILDERKNNLLKELVSVLNSYEGGKETFGNQGQALDGFSALYTFIDIAKKARSIC